MVFQQCSDAHAVGPACGTMRQRPAGGRHHAGVAQVACSAWLCHHRSWHYAAVPALAVMCFVLQPFACNTLEAVSLATEGAIA